MILKLKVSLVQVGYLPPGQLSAHLPPVSYENVLMSHSYNWIDKHWVCYTFVFYIKTKRKKTKNKDIVVLVLRYPAPV